MFVKHQNMNFSNIAFRISSKFADNSEVITQMTICVLLPNTFLAGALFSLLWAERKLIFLA